jgi:hypothetical protein
MTSTHRQRRPSDAERSRRRPPGLGRTDKVAATVSGIKQASAVAVDSSTDTASALKLAVVDC